MKVATRRLLEEQIAAVIVPGRGEKNDAMWHVPQEARVVQIDFSAAFDRVNHLGILYKLCSVGIGCALLSILTQFPSNRSQHVMVDGCRSKLVHHQECHRAVFWARYCSVCTLRSFFPFWKIS